MMNKKQKTSVSQLRWHKIAPKGHRIRLIVGREAYDLFRETHPKYFERFCEQVDKQKNSDRRLIALSSCSTVDNKNISGFFSHKITVNSDDAYGGYLFIQIEHPSTEEDQLITDRFFESLPGTRIK